MARVRPLELERTPQLTAKLFVDVLKVPWTTLRLAALPSVRALPRVHPPPAPWKVTPPVSVVPLVVTVLPVVVALNVIVPLALHTVPAAKDMEPLIANVGDVPVANVTVPADTVMSKQVNAPVQVTV